MALNKYNITPVTNYGLNAIKSVNGPLVNGIKVNRLMNMYQEGAPVLVNNEGQWVTDNEYGPVFTGKPGYLAGQIAIFARMIQALEIIKYACYTQCDLQTATAYTLQRWGALLNVPPQGLTDAQYRTVLFATIIEYSSKGGIETLIQILKTLTGATSVLLQELFPAKFQITAINANPEISFTFISNAIQNAKAGGVGYSIGITDFNPFVFQGDNSGTGFGGLTNLTPLLNESGDIIYDEYGYPYLVYVAGYASLLGGDFAGVL
jgi:hypothetical protein